jgi:hypothetical protein
MVVGEPQILGQVKEAFAVARAAGTVAGQLEHLLQSAFAAAKKVRTETEIGSKLGFHCFGGRGPGEKDLWLAARADGLPGGRGQNERTGGAASGAAGGWGHPGEQPDRRIAPAAWPSSSRGA